MKRIISIVISILLVLAMMPQMAFAGTETTYDISITGSVGNSYQVGINFEPNSMFKKDNSSFSTDLAITSLVLSLKNQNPDELKGDLETLGFNTDSIRSYDFDRTGKEEYMTGYTYATKEIKRNGKACTLLFVAVNSASADNGTDTTSGWKSILPDLDFLNHEMDKKTGATTDYNSTKALTFTKASEQILEGSSNVPDGESIDSLVSQLNANTSKDYLVWVVGQSRGGAVGNYLSKLLVDKYGKNHVVSYLFSVPNVDKDAANQTAEQKAKYNTIFNIVNPDDVVTYVPFGAEGGEDWGYARWGTDVNLKCLATADAQTTLKQAAIFESFVDGADQTRMFYSDGTYYGYSKDEGNGKAIKDMIKEFSAKVGSPQNYYEGTVTYNASGSGINIMQYLIDVKNGKESLLNVLMKVKSSGEASGSGLYAFSNFAIRHVLGFGSVSEATSAIMKNATNMSNIRFAVHEAYYAHTPENYLSWMMAENEVAKTVQASKVTLKAGVQKVSGKKVVKLTWTKSGNTKVDSYQVYRSAKNTSSYKKIAATKNGTILKYNDSNSLKKGTKYYYKVRGVKAISGQTVYTKWSNAVGVKYN